MFSSFIPNDFTSRDDAIQWLQAYQSGEVELPISHRPPLKTYLLCLPDSSTQIGELGMELRDFGWTTRQIGAGFHSVHDVETEQVCAGFLEAFDERYLAFYTAWHTRRSDSFIHKAIESANLLDNAWLNGGFLKSLMLKTIQKYASDRFVGIGFAHESLYRGAHGATDNASGIAIEERALARFSFVERIDVVQRIFAQFQTLYEPFQAIQMIRLPDEYGSGYHDIYEDGKITNRSHGFTGHWKLIRRIVRDHNQIVHQIEKSASGSRDKIPIGAPIRIRYKNGMNSEGYAHWLKAVFSSRANKIRLWGTPVEIEGNRHQIDALDRHGWRPLIIDATPDSMTILLPKGTSGASILRIAAQIERTIDPTAQIHIGSRSLSEIIRELVGRPKNE